MGCNIGDVEVSRIIEAFRAFDVDCNGRIDRQELGRLLWTLNPVFDDRSVGALYNALDQNGDGKIDYEEFVCWLFCDEKTRSKLWIAGTEEAGNPIEVKVTLGDGHTCNLKVMPQLTVRDLRLRTCCALRVPVERLSDLELHSGKETLADKKRVFELRSRDLAATLACRPGGLLLAAVGSQVACIRLESLQMEDQVDACGRIQHIQHSAESNVIVAVAADYEVLVWDADSRKLLWSQHMEMVLNVLVVGSAAVFASTEDGLVVAWSARTGKQLWRFGIANTVEAVKRLTHVSQMNCLCAGSDAGRVVLWDGSTGRELWRRQHQGTMPEITHLVTTDGSTLFSGDVNATVVAWELRTGTKLWEARLGCPIVSILHHPAADNLFVSLRSGMLLGLAPRKGSERTRVEGKFEVLAQGIEGLLFASDGSFIVALDSLHKCKERWRTDVKGSPEALIYLRDGDTVLVITHTGAMVVLTATTGTKISVAHNAQLTSSYAYIPPNCMPPVLRAAVEARSRAESLLHEGKPPTPKAGTEMRRTASCAGRITEGVPGDSAILMAARRRYTPGTPGSPSDSQPPRRAAGGQESGRRSVPTALPPASPKTPVAVWSAGDHASSSSSWRPLTAGSSAGPHALEPPDVRSSRSLVLGAKSPVDDLRLQSDELPVGRHRSMGTLGAGQNDELPVGRHRSVGGFGARERMALLPPTKHSPPPSEPGSSWVVELSAYIPKTGAHRKRPPVQAPFTLSPSSGTTFQLPGEV